MKSKSLENIKYILRTNYGDDSIALIQWAFESKLKPVTVVYLDTGWAAKDWIDRVTEGEHYAQTICQFKTKRIHSKITFDQAVIGRGEFPSAKFQWCASLLKGLPFLDWLDEIDPHCQAVILHAKRKMASKAHAELPEYIDNCEYHNDRKVWHPLFNVTDVERNNLLMHAGFIPLHHRSLECQPCINSTEDDLIKLQDADIVKIQALETAVNLDMFSGAPLDNSNGILKTVNQVKCYQKRPINISVNINENQVEKIINESEHYLDRFYRGCGNPWGCGL